MFYGQRLGRQHERGFARFLVSPWSGDADVTFINLQDALSEQKPGDKVLCKCNAFGAPAADEQTHSICPDHCVPLIPSYHIPSTLGHCTPDQLLNLSLHTAPGLEYVTIGILASFQSWIASKWSPLSHPQKVAMLPTGTGQQAQSFQLHGQHSLGRAVDAML